MRRVIFTLILWAFFTFFFVINIVYYFIELGKRVEHEFAFIVEERSPSWIETIEFCSLWLVRIATIVIICIAPSIYITLYDRYIFHWLKRDRFNVYYTSTPGRYEIFALGTFEFFLTELRKQGLNVAE